MISIARNKRLIKKGLAETKEGDTQEGKAVSSGMFVFDSIARKNYLNS